MEGLVVGRRVGEGVDIDGPAFIRVVQIRGGRAVLQIIAPDSTRILRDEFLGNGDSDGIENENGSENGNADAGTPGQRYARRPTRLLSPQD